MELLNFTAFGEVIAVVATVATLAYLAMQIRLSNKLAVSAIEHQLNTRVYDRRFETARDDHFCEFLSKDWGSENLTRMEKTKVAQYVTMLIIDAREVFFQDKLGFVSEHLLQARVDVLKRGIMNNDISKSVWFTYRKLVDPDFASFFEKEIYPDGLSPEVESAHPLTKPGKKLDQP
ncbi:MAG: hypothetical protein CMQ41_03370 [Gammaproteobacteria bacterium]|nr:hypothetical protein [Gammaproteobacteria bacterium]|tara:strand:+ start:1165 stop:1692 length:528 start_codon:yes stop_codon:yes gene_type:complete